MKVLIVNTSERAGGAAVAASRLCEALNNNGVKTRMLVRDKQTGDISVLTTGHRVLGWLYFIWERLIIFFHLRLRRDHLFDIDTASSGFNITRMREFKEADVIHLQWVNQGMLSLGGIRKILASGKPVVWTMHDLWPATAICHLSLGCRHFTSACHHCKYLPGGGSRNDLAARVWSRKQRLLHNHAISFVACSRWLAGEAKASALLRGQTVVTIPNPIDTRLYCPGDRVEARRAEELPTDGMLLLFACQRVSNPNKGMSYLVDACHTLADAHPEMLASLRIAILGSHADEVKGQIPFECITLGYVSDEHRLVNIYRSADVFVLPSLSENLPNTIMEAMACGVPCVGFRVGGIPEEIDHRKNGYVAAYRDAADLARGIWWVLAESDRQQLSKDAVRKVMHNYSLSSVAVRYVELYQQAIAQKHFKL